MCCDVMIIIEANHIEIDYACDVELERLVDHVECNSSLYLTRIIQESLFVDTVREKIILECGRHGKFDIMAWLAEPLDRFIEFLFRFTQRREVLL